MNACRSRGRVGPSRDAGVSSTLPRGGRNPGSNPSLASQDPVVESGAKTWGTRTSTLLEMAGTTSLEREVAFQSREGAALRPPQLHVPFMLSDCANTCRHLPLNLGTTPLQSLGRQPAVCPSVQNEHQTLLPSVRPLAARGLASPARPQDGGAQALGLPVGELTFPGTHQRITALQVLHLCLRWLTGEQPGGQAAKQRLVASATWRQETTGAAATSEVSS